MRTRYAACSRDGHRGQSLAEASRNTGAAPLRILCACAPAYARDDTELL